MINSFFGIPAILILLSLIGQTNLAHEPNVDQPFFIVNGSMPAKPLQTTDRMTIIFGMGDSLMEVSGIPGKTMHAQTLIAVIPKMFSHAMRGPQSALTSKGVVITACTEDGDIFSYKEDQQHQWKRTAQLNQPGSAKEGLLSLAGDGENLVAVWLNARKPKGQSIFAATSSDGGQTWTSREIYASPYGSTCECCKPSVVMNNKVVYVMFRNWLDGNRDMHILKSIDGGQTFNAPQKLGTGNWKLNGCPMDGGDIQIDKSDQPVTIWRREGKLYSATGTGNETQLADGKNGCVIPGNNGNVYAWTDKGMVIVQTADGKKINLGEGSLPLITNLNNGTMLCIWQKEKTIMGSFINAAL